MQVISTGEIEIRYYSDSGGLETQKGHLSFGSGFWFEEVVANAFLKIQPKEVQVGVKWAWPREDLAQPGSHKDEVDVLVQYKGRFLAVSCKTGRNISISEAAQEIEAVTLKNLGRFGIPIFIRPEVNVEMISQTIFSGRGTVVLDLATITDADKLKEMLEDIFDSRSTLGR
ncbi:MAG: hypothetical protein HY709_10815 [Candidatus Latescibacteria bacterium]|nr:hypothetical protein [Candidatus Latescibacterota bacterium]